MKKRITSLALALCLCAMLLLSACGEQPGNTGPEPPVYGFYDTVTQTTFQLGDPKEKFDEAFGEPEIAVGYLIGEIEGRYEYLEDKSLNVSYDKNNNAQTFFLYATNMSVTNPKTTSIIDRFEFNGGFKLGLSRKTMRQLYGEPNKLTENESAAVFIYYRDAEGNPVDTSEGKDNYTLKVSTWNNQIEEYSIFR